MHRWIAVAALLGLAQAQAPPPTYFVQASPTVFGMFLPAAGGNPESHCWAWVHLGGFYDTEVACYVGGAFVAPIMAARKGQRFDGGFPAPGGYIRWLFCNPASVTDCPKRLPAAPPALVDPMYFQMGAGLNGTPDQTRDGYY